MQPGKPWAASEDAVQGAKLLWEMPPEKEQPAAAAVGAVPRHKPPTVTNSN
jgi:hypothetical protein